MEQKQKRGRKSHDKRTTAFTLDRDLVAKIEELPEGQRSNDVNQKLRAAYGLPEKVEIKMYEIRFELSIGEETIKDTLQVEADSQERAIEFAKHILEERYEDGVLLECQIVA